MEAQIGISAPAASLPDAWGSLDVIVAAGKVGGLALFFDYDGTLTPIVAKPEEAVLDPRVRELLERLAGVARIAIVSGRDLDDVMHMVGIEGITYSGSHGFETARPDSARLIHEAAPAYLDDLRAAAESLDERVGRIQGARVERKQFAVTVHFRLTPPEFEYEVESEMLAVARAFPRLRLTEGKKVLELRPNLPWGKGELVTALCAEWGAAGAFPVFLGDDVTDEDAFKAIHGRGVGIVVSRSDTSTAATYRLSTPAETAEWLRALLDRLEGGQPVDQGGGRREDRTV